MNFRQKLFYTILGGLLVFVGTLANNISSHETNKHPEFTTIKCDSIQLGDYGKEKGGMLIYADGDRVGISIESGNQRIDLECHNRYTLPSCGIRLQGGSNGEKLIGIESGEYSDLELV